MPAARVLRVLLAAAWQHEAVDHWEQLTTLFTVVHSLLMHTLHTMVYYLSLPEHTAVPGK